MDPQPDRPESSNSSDLSDSDSDIITIFPYFDLSMRRTLVMELPYRKELSVGCRRHDSNDGRWICEHETRIREGEVQEEIFASRQDAYEKMKELIKTTEDIKYLCIELESGSITSLVDGNKLTDVANLYLCFQNGIDEETNQSYNRILRQVNPDKLELLHMRVEHLQNHQKELIRDQFLDLERTSFVNLKEFYFKGHLNDQQLLGMRTPTITIEDSTAITPAGLVNLVQKVVLQTTPTKTLVLFETSNEMQICLFGRLLRDEANNPYRLILNSVLPGWKVIIQFFKDDDEDDDNDDDNDENGNEIIDKPVHIEINFIKDGRNRVVYGDIQKDSNSEVIGNFPSLGDFLSLVAAGLPDNFPLLHDGAFSIPE